MELKKAMHIARNPFGWNEFDVREARLAVCDEVERLERENLRLLPGAANKASREKAIYDGAFASGVVYAAARLVEMYDQPGMAATIVRESGVDVRMASEYDVSFLRKETPSLPSGKE